MANGGPTRAETWNGKTWRAIRRPPGGLGGVSCSSRSLCMAIDPHINGGVAESWNGNKWRIWAQASNVCGGPPGFPCGLASVACGSADNCLAVGTVTVSQEPIQQTAAVAWDGRGWDGAGLPSAGDPAALNAAGCAGNFCMAVGGGYGDAIGGDFAIAGTWDASTRTSTDVSPNLGVICRSTLQTCSWANVISCGSATNCVTLGSWEVWNGASWTHAPAISAGRGSNLGDVSCGDAFCLAVGHRTVAGTQQTLAELWNGKAWQILGTPKVG
jgi:hypothetical protein